MSCDDINSMRKRTFVEGTEKMQHKISFGSCVKDLCRHIKKLTE